MKRKFLLALVVTMPLIAADISGPVLGYVHRGTTTVQPIIGIPGAAHFGDPIQIGDLVIAAVSSSAGYVVAATPDGTQFHVLLLRTGVPVQPVLLSDDASTVDSIVLSASGAALGVVRSRDRRIDIFTGLPSSPTKQRTLTLSAVPLSVAVSDDGAAVAIAEGTTILSVFERDEARQIAANDLRHVSFRPASHDFTYIDGDLVIIVSDAVSTLVAGAADGVTNARSVLRSRDGRSVVTLNAGAKELLITRDGATQRLDLPCAVSEIESVSNSDFRLACESSGRVHLVDLSDRGPRVLFVPEPVE